MKKQNKKKELERRWYRYSIWLGNRVDYIVNKSFFLES